jgi:hypothetical protein
MKSGKKPRSAERKRRKSKGDNMSWYKKSQEKIGNWGGQTVYHGTDLKSAQNILSGGVQIAASTGGYFGRGFYTTPDVSLAKSNYADFAADEENESPGAILSFTISSSARILDMRDENDSDFWMRISKRGSIISADDFDKIMVSNGIDGLFDRSFDGVVIYNPSVLLNPEMVEKFTGG